MHGVDILLGKVDHFYIQSDKPEPCGPVSIPDSAVPRQDAFDGAGLRILQYLWGYLEARHNLLKVSQCFRC